MTTVADISKLLADRVLAVSMMLLPGGREIPGRSEYVCGSINGGEGESLKVSLNGGHAGQWRDWANQDHYGDLLDLWRLTKNVSPGEAVRQAKEYLGIKDGLRDDLMAKKKYALQAPKKDTTPPNPQGFAFKWLTETRKITKETLDAFKIEVDPESRAIVFPCYSPDGILKNRSYRTVPKDGDKKVWQEKGCAPCLFGWQALPQSAYESRAILLTEGQFDAMTFHQWGIPALSIPNGSGQTWITYAWDDLLVFDTIYIAFDMDEAGEENAEKAIKRLGAHRCLRVQIPHKDANDALRAGKTALDAQQWVSSAKAPTPDGMITASALEKRIGARLKKQPKPPTLEAFDKGWPDDGLYFRPGEFTLWTGGYGNGKSSFLNHLIVELLVQNQPVFIASMEVLPEVTLKNIVICNYTAMGYYYTGEVFRDDEVEITLEQAIMNSLKHVGEFITFADIVGYIKKETLLEMMWFSFRRYGTTHFFADSLMRIESLEEDYIAQAEFVSEIQKFVKATNTHVHLVAHPRKIDRADKASGIDVKGSSAIPNNADTIVSVTRNPVKTALLMEKDWNELTAEEREMHDTEVTVDKQRNSGWLGSFCFHYDRRGLHFTPCKRYVKPKPEPRSNNKNWNKSPRF